MQHTHLRALMPGTGHLHRGDPADPGSADHPFLLRVVKVSQSGLPDTGVGT